VPPERALRTRGSEGLPACQLCLLSLPPPQLAIDFLIAPATDAGIGVGQSYLLQLKSLATRGARASMFPPQRIVCLTEETVETLYLLGEQDRIVGISGYVMRPPQARREKPRVSAFTSANINKIVVLTPDLVLTFSDLQADIAADLIRRGLDVHAFNQQSIAGILDMIRTVGAMVDASDRAEQLVTALEARLAEARNRAECLPQRPKVFFEEWDDPLISGIGWVSELVEIAGGIDIFANRARQGAAKDRVVTVDEVIAREPDLILGSWCGKKFRPERVAARPGFVQIPGCAAPRDLRDKVATDPAARSRRSDRRPRRARDNHRALGGNSLLKCVRLQ
jgi:iron complex transport system substrate-binding protein